MSFSYVSRRALVVACLIACANGCSDGSLFPGVLSKKRPNALTFLSPFDGAQDVLPSSPVLARVASTVDDAALASTLRLFTSDGTEVPSTVRSLEKGALLTLTPNAPLAASARYEVRFTADESNVTTSAFTVAAGGSRSTDGLSVLSIQPLDQRDAKVWPYSTLHVLFSEPIRTETATVSGQSLGAPTVRLLHGTTGAEVRGTVIARGSRLAFDPDEDLQPGTTYILELGREIRDLSGESLTPVSRSFVVSDAPLARKVSLVLGEEQKKPEGSLDGRTKNTLELRSSLVGTQEMHVSGTLQTEMPDLANAGARIPMVVRKGQTMSLSVADPLGLSISLYGEIPTGLHSGPLTLVLLTDSVGEIVENPFASQSADTKPVVRMVLDASLAAGDLSVHTLLNQDLLHLQLTGLLGVDGDRLSVELVGGAELQLMGMETAPSVVTLAAASSVPMVGGLSEPLKLVGTRPLAGAKDVAVDGELRLVLSAPGDGKNLSQNVWLEPETGDGVQGSADDVPSDVRLDGSTLFVRPLQPLAGGASYQIRVAKGLRGASGSTLDADQSIAFNTRVTSPDATRPVMVTAVRPGVPCALVPSGAGLGCTSSLAGVDAGSLAANFPIEVSFTKPVDPNTLRLGGSVRVERADGGVPAGRLEAHATSFRFVPDEPWTVGDSYRLTLNKRTDVACGVERICDREGSALNTDVLLDALEEAGGAPLEIPFTASAATADTTMAMGLSPIVDTNANGRIDAPAETLSEENSVSMRGSDGGVAARTYLSGALLATVGPYDPAREGVPVTVAPGSWMFGTSTVMFGIVTDRLVMRPAQSASGVLRRPEPSDPDRRPVVTVAFKAYVDSVNDTVQQALQREPLELQLVGRLSFGTDGTLVMELSNSNPSQLSLLQGNLVLTIAAGDVRVRAVTAPLKQ